jgi:hypothetical protein
MGQLPENPQKLTGVDATGAICLLNRRKPAF